MNSKVWIINQVKILIWIKAMYKKKKSNQAWYQIIKYQIQVLKNQTMFKWCPVKVNNLNQIMKVLLTMNLMMIFKSWRFPLKNIPKAKTNITFWKNRIIKLDNLTIQTGSLCPITFLIKITHRKNQADEVFLSNKTK